ncbi:MAG: hypothetical protein HF978_06390 [Desulfobacteraceae bacterium]|nr:hypothetical protein [Desulfobacteraceae bacterium]MBC2755159.1 hypothetical protein [Desulfobacteraceae bacterium]
METENERVNRIFEEITRVNDGWNELKYDVDEKRIRPISQLHPRRSRRYIDIEPSDADLFGLDRSDSIIVISSEVIQKIKPRAKRRFFFKSLDKGTVFTLLENKFASKKVPGTIYINDDRKKNIDISRVGQADDIVRVIINRHKKAKAARRY